VTPLTLPEPEPVELLVAPELETDEPLELAALPEVVELLVVAVVVAWAVVAA
jgi:hypothetical protein